MVKTVFSCSFSRLKTLFCNKKLFKSFLNLCVYFVKKAAQLILEKRPWLGCRKLPDPSFNRNFNALLTGVQYTLSFQLTSFELECLPLWSFNLLFFQVFLFFTTVFYLLSLRIAFFHVTNFLCPNCFFAAFCQVVHFCVALPRVLQIWESFFYPQVFFTSQSNTAAVAPVLLIWERCYYSQAFFTLHSFPTFGTTCFYQGFPGSQ